MAKQQSSSLVTIALLAIGGYFLYENWATISADLALPAAGAVASSATTYPNSPVPLTTPIGSDFVDSAGNEWQYNTQTGAWVIVVSAPSAGTVVATPAPAAVPAVVPATAGTIIPTAPAEGAVVQSVAIPVQPASTDQSGTPTITRVILPGSFWRGPRGPMPMPPGWAPSQPQTSTAPPAASNAATTYNAMNASTPFFQPAP